jgi:hypothetical protein
MQQRFGYSSVSPTVCPARTPRPAINTVNASIWWSRPVGTVEVAKTRHFGVKIRSHPVDTRPLV